jgi:hypothetical protein
MMMRLTKSLSTTLAIALVVLTAPADAQQPRQKSPPVQGTVGQQGVYHGGYGQTPWFSNPGTRQHLNLNDAQYNLLNTGYGQAYGIYQQGMTNMGKDLSPEQRSQKMAELQHGFNKSFTTTANGVITDPQQLSRYNQVQLQYQGYDAFSNPMVQDKLKLTPEQRQKMAQQGQDWHKQMNNLGSTYQTDPQGTAKRFNAMRYDSGRGINSVLTPQQQKSYLQLTGQSYNFQPSAYFQPSSNAGTSPQTNPK